MPPHPRFHRWVVCPLIIIQGFLLGFEAYFDGPTYNEPGHLAAGLSEWKFGRFDVYRVNPPLVHLISAVPVMLHRPKMDWQNYYEGPGTRPEYALGEAFVTTNSKNVFWLFTVARWACIPFSLIGGYVCFRWAETLSGTTAGLVALLLWCFCPNILGHGHLITCDVAGTSLGLVARFTFWRWLQQPSWGRTVASGLALVAAELAKMTLIVLVPLWFILWLVYRFPAHRRLRRDDWLKELGMLFARFVLALYIVNLGYLFEGSFTRLGDFTFVSKVLSGNADGSSGNRFANAWPAHIPIPLPKNYVLGLDLQKSDFEHYSQPSYLNGQFQDTGWWYYYLYALAIKVPLGTWFLLSLALTAGFWERIKVCCRDEFVLLCPPIIIAILVSSQTGFSEHMRYILPAFPFAFIWIGRVATLFPRKRWLISTISIAALASSIVSSLLAYPHSLSYFNELAGGPKNGGKYLLQSNVDWGQDLLCLRKWLDEHPEATPLKLAYFGSIDPTYAGIDYTAPTGGAVAYVAESSGLQDSYGRRTGPRL